MAARKNNEELKQQARMILAEGRSEITGEINRIREQLSPTRAMHSAVDKHTLLVVLAALSAGLVPALLFFKRERPAKLLRPPTTREVKPGVLIAVAPFVFGLLAKTITPALVKTAVVDPLIRYLHKKG